MIDKLIQLLCWHRYELYHIDEMAYFRNGKLDHPKYSIKCIWCGKVVESEDFDKLVKMTSHTRGRQNIWKRCWKK